ncbi:MAG: ferritin family protein [Planctomycetes bacterium]|nr:ferritin family protein [Planctomycetota bacterium]
MANVEKVANILETAVEKEIEAYRFYSTVAELISDEKGRDVFRQLANDEIKHRNRLELEIMKIGKVLKPREDVDIDIEVESGFKLSYKEALIMAIQKEDAAFQLYIEYVIATSDLELREVFMRLAEEEVKHKVKFEIEYNRLAVK